MIKFILNIISKLKNYNMYKDWKARKKGKPVCDFEKGPGYYPVIDKQYEWRMPSGKIMLVKLIDSKTYEDPLTMVQWSKWEYLC